MGYCTHSVGGATGNAYFDVFTDIEKKTQIVAAICITGAAEATGAATDNINGSTTNAVIGNKRLSNKKYYDDVMRIDMSGFTNVDADKDGTADADNDIAIGKATCEYLGQTLYWDSFQRKCYFEAALATYHAATHRQPKLIYYELQYMNYEVLDMNF